MSDEFVRDVRTLLASGKGDASRLRDILESIKQGNPVYMSDYKYVSNLAAEGDQQSAEVQEEGVQTQNLMTRLNCSG